eukprot:TRINITY_DN12770_c0_g7_i1.p2 TRINITY_DN12770_c0_g7~~TRINITY_DN12770_c0_g7_i1.p2  ORF type:complete len:196 (-),score=26.27 TRINITY_DN12770_c0_g7_i1:912-1499(-)
MAEMIASRSENDALQLPLKNTFVHFDDALSPPGLPPRQTVSCLSVVQTHTFRTKAWMEEHLAKKLKLHSERGCRPCAFFVYKADGCRMGDACEYCHLCTRTEIRRWKRTKAKYASSRCSECTESTDDGDVMCSQSSMGSSFSSSFSSAFSSEADSESFSAFRRPPSSLASGVERLVFKHPAKKLLSMRSNAGSIP